MVRNTFLFVFLFGILHASGQEVTINYNEDGSAVVNSTPSSGDGFWILKDNLLTHEEVLFPDGTRNKWSSFKYDETHIIEKQEFEYGSPRRRFVMEYDEFGNKTSIEEFSHISGNDWKSQYKEAAIYDSLNKLMASTRKGIQNGEFVNERSITTYDLNTEMSTTTVRVLNRYGNQLKKYVSNEYFSQDMVNTRIEEGKLENQLNRILTNHSKDSKGNRIVTITTEVHKSVQIFNKYGLLVEHQLHKAIDGFNSVIDYELNYTFKFIYDSKKRVIESRMMTTTNGSKEWKSVYGLNADGNNIKETTYRRSGSRWLQTDSKWLDGTSSVYTPRYIPIKKKYIVPELPEPYAAVQYEQ